MVESFKKIIFLSFLAVIVFSFLALGYDMPAQLSIRLPLLWITASACVISFFIGNKISVKSLPVSFWCFVAVIVFQVARAAYGLIVLKEEEVLPLAKTFMGSLFWWASYFAIFTLALTQFSEKKNTQVLIWVLGGACLFLAVNTLPALFAKGAMHYKTADGKNGFFFPVFYSMKWMPRYIFSRFAHPNNISTIIAVGLMPFLAMAFYSLLSWIDSFKQKSKLFKAEPNQAFMANAALFLVLACVIGTSVLLIQSRGSIAFFALAVAVFFGAIMLKYPSLIMGTILSAILALGGIFFIWTGKLEKLQKEMQTIEQEQEAANISPDKAVYKGKSIYTNIAGKKNSLRIYEKNPLWGVGFGGYMRAVKELKTEKGYERYGFAKAFALSHYYQTLAEEGKGAFLYFLFLAVYGIEMVWRLIKTNSRFQFLIALALACSALMMLGHGSINELLERFTTSTILYTLMGASLAISSKNFKHQ